MQHEFDYKLDGEVYKVIVTKKNNKNTYIKVKEDLTINVSTNYLATRRYIKGLLDSERDYLRKVLHKLKVRAEKEAEFYYLGEKYDIIWVPFSKVEVEGTRIFAKDEQQLEKWLKSEMKRIFMERLEYNYNLFDEDIPFPKLKIRNMKTRWGVCNKRDDSVTLNSKLIKYDIKEIDYVIIHELSHFVHFDHSKDFWKTVSYYMPDYKQAVKVLNG